MFLVLSPVSPGANLRCGPRQRSNHLRPPAGIEQPEGRFQQVVRSGGAARAGPITRVWPPSPRAPQHGAAAIGLGFRGEARDTDPRTKRSCTHHDLLQPLWSSDLAAVVPVNPIEAGARSLHAPARRISCGPRRTAISRIIRGLSRGRPHTHPVIMVVGLPTTRTFKPFFRVRRDAMVSSPILGDREQGLFHPRALTRETRDENVLASTLS